MAKNKMRLKILKNKNIGKKMNKKLENQIKSNQIKKKIKMKRGVQQ